MENPLARLRLAPILLDGDAGRVRVVVSFPALDAENAEEVWQAGEGAALPTFQAAAFPDADALRAEVGRALARVPAVSVALGGGADGRQWRKVLAGGRAGACHLNQPFSTAGAAKAAAVEAAAGRDPAGAAPPFAPWVNGVVAPAGAPGRVRLQGVSSPGPEVAAEDAAALLADADVDALKFHPAGGATGLEEVRAACLAAARAGLCGFEPAGGVDLRNVRAIVEACLQTGIPWLLPHVFGAVQEGPGGRTVPERVAEFIRLLA